MSEALIGRIRGRTASPLNCLKRVQVCIAAHWWALQMLEQKQRWHTAADTRVSAAAFADVAVGGYPTACSPTVCGRVTCSRMKKT